MNAKISRMWRSGVALLLALCLVVGFVPTAFAATREEVESTAESALVEIEDSLNNLMVVLDKYAPKAPKAIWNLWVELGYVDAVEEAIDELGAKLPALNDKLMTGTTMLDDAIAKLEDEKNVLVGALAAVNDALAAKKAALEAVLAGQEIGDIYIPEINIDGIGGNEQTQVPENDCVVEGEGVVAELNAAIADLEHAAAVIAALIADIEADLADMANLAAQLMAAAEELDLSVASILAAAEDVKVAYENVKEVLTSDNDEVTDAFAAAYEAAKKAAVEAVEVLKWAVEKAHGLDDDMADLIATANDKAEALHDQVVADLTAFVESVDKKTVYEALMSFYENGDAADKKLVKDLITLYVAVKEAEAYLTDKETNLEEDCNKAIQWVLDNYKEEIDAAEKALADKWDEIEPQITAKYNELKAEIIADYQATVAALTAQKLALEAEIKAAKEALANTAEDAVAPLLAQIERLEKDLATVNADLAHAAGHLQTALKLAYEEAKVAVLALYDEVMAELHKAIEDLKAQLKQALEDLKNAVKEMIEDAIKAAVDSILGEIINTLVELKDALIAMGIETVEELVDALVALFNEMLYEATHADLVIHDGFKYVALGDGSAVTESYVEELAAILDAEAEAEGVKPITFENCAYVGNTVAAEAAALSEGAADADLITVGFSQTDMLINAVLALELGEPDWAALLGEEAVPYVEEALAAVAEEIAALDVDAETEAVINALVEAYAYNAVEFAVELPALIKAIRDVNEEAVVIVVGMYNPLAGLNIEAAEAFAGYFDDLVKAVDVYGIGLAMLTGAMDFVSAPAVEVDETDIIGLVQGDVSSLYANANGDIYVAEKIAEALNLSFEIGGLWGDANGDGKVLANDAQLILQYTVGLITADDLNLAVCDVNGDGAILANDAQLVLQHTVGLITEFPVEK